MSAHSVEFTAIRLSGHDRVQQELKLTDNQKSKIRETMKVAREEGGKVFQGLHEALESERAQKFKESQQAGEKILKAARAKTDEILQPEQRKRLQEITLQVSGSAALRDPQLVEQLKLTSEQKAKVEKLFAEAAKNHPHAGPAGFGRGPHGHHELDGKVAEILTADQKKQWEDLKGAKFDLGGPRSRSDEKKEKGPAKDSDAKPDAKPESKPEVKPESKPEAKPEAAPEKKAEASMLPAMAIV